MCYSAQVVDAWHEFVRRAGAVIALRDFAALYGFRLQDRSVHIPRAIDAAFAHPANEVERGILADIERFEREQALAWEEALFTQRKRLADAQRTLQTRPTKAAAESARIATRKIEWLRGKRADLQRKEPLPADARIFPGWYAPVMVVEQGRKVVKPMRYQCRPAGKPASYDRRYPGTYNARRDNLQGFWKAQFGVTHGVLPVRRFYENVQRDGAHVVLEFSPADGQPMWVACLWSHWSGPEGELYSFAAITDEPPPEVAAAGHDRCIVPLKPENVDAWLNPDPAHPEASFALLDDRQRPYYEHRLAA